MNMTAKMPITALFTVIKIEIKLNVQQEGIKWIMVHNTIGYYIYSHWIWYIATFINKENILK